MKPVNHAVQAARIVFAEALPGSEFDYDYNLGIIWVNGTRVWERPRDSATGVRLPDACFRMSVAVATLEEAKQQLPPPLPADFQPLPARSGCCPEACKIRARAPRPFWPG